MAKHVCHERPIVFVRYEGCVRRDLMRFQHAVHDGDVAVRDLVDRDVTSMESYAGGVCQEQKVASVECRFHRATKMQMIH